MKRQLATLGLIIVLMGSVTAPSLAGKVQAAPHTYSAHVQAPPAYFDKTRFAFHMGFAYFAFHHFVYNPYRHGDFKPGRYHRTLRIVKAGVALLVTYHELKKAYDIAKGSNSSVLRAIVKPLGGLVSAANRVATKLRGGQYNDNEVKGVVNSANGFSRTLTHNGLSIRDIPVPGLGG